MTSVIIFKHIDNMSSCIPVIYIAMTYFKPTILASYFRAVLRNIILISTDVLYMYSIYNTKIYVHTASLQGKADMIFRKGPQTPLDRFYNTWKQTHILEG